MLAALLAASGAATLAAALVATPALAHTGVSPVHDLAHGLLHPLSGLDHVLAMVAVGLYAAHLGGTSLWLLPAAFVGAMLAGGVVSYAGVALPMVEPAIALSVIAMGAALALGVRLPAPAATVLVAAFAVAHGHAHGSEGGAVAAFLPYAAGFVAVTALLHAVGIAAGLVLDRLGRMPATVLKRVAGAAGVVAGVVILAG
jgi:urease accessory protein